MAWRFYGAAWAAQGLTPAQKLVLLKLADASNDEGECFPSFGYITKDTGICRRTVIAAVKALEEAGHLLVRREQHRKDGSDKSNTYVLRLPAWWGEKNAPPGATIAPPGENAAPLEPVIDPLSSREKSSPPGSSPSEPLDPRARCASAFDAFWKLYPRRVGRGKAEKAWAVERCESINGKLLAAVTAQQAPGCQLDVFSRGSKYVPHPATWLNQRRWEDEAEVQTGGREPSPARRKTPPPIPEGY